MSDTEKINQQNHAYWTDRASGYSEVNQEELAGIQKKNWSDLLDREIRDHFKIRETQRSRIHILDIGAGPGFLSIILSEQGYQVTAADFAETMLEEAKQNAGTLAEQICFRREDAMNLSFPEATFDVVLSRNLTWNLPDPQRAYKEWLRVLKHNGLLLIFDANWYAYLRDTEKKQAYDKDRDNVKKQGYEDYNIGANFDIMEKIADELPMTGRHRPAWDEAVFGELGVQSVSSEEDIGSQVYSEKEKINYASTPMFMIKVIR
ncbi:MAG: class I SAM-dependent methyltransferase [Lachnospiraceae bacterium]|nr:class I SAM-dependent methyltransferase [Lachnospiraceae bacterium]